MVVVSSIFDCTGFCVAFFATLRHARLMGIL
jgi:hypothetical protein